MSRPLINPDFSLDLRHERTLEAKERTVSVVIPAHNERDTVTEVVSDAFRALEILQVEGEVLVSASGCTDDTADVADKVGAIVVEAPIGKGAAINAGVQRSGGDIICLVDGDVRYYGDPPLVALIVDPILRGIADACITDLYWRPIYPQMWQCGFFTPLAGRLIPEILPKSGSTPWSGQRAALRHLWPASLPADFTADIELLLHWNRHALRLRPVLTDDWVNPQRPKPDLMAQELEVILHYALESGRIQPDLIPSAKEWYEIVHALMATYRPGEDDPQDFEVWLSDRSIGELITRLNGVDVAD